ncbi:hypothetical protein [Pyrobaculum aerophilum]|uniref:P. aerophilum family 70 protein n=1 Tax=Pyrobaculum aerophilum TaxID=13773 RepID=A0A832W5H7_9CREN|nr:hypothetical protein [Pyrobaculum aerophilum]HII47994.1 hypothetical protein [Pyrobaculum aerophilum]
MRWALGGSILKSSSLFSLGLLFLFSASLLPLGSAQLIRANVAYTFSVVSAVCLFVSCRRYFYTAAAFGAVLWGLSFAYPHFLVAFLSMWLYLGWAWLGLLWASWRLWRVKGVVTAFAALYVINLMYIPLEFANLLPDWALAAIGDNPRTTFLNWARYLLTYLTTMAVLQTIRVLAKLDQRRR